VSIIYHKNVLKLNSDVYKLSELHQ